MKHISDESEISQVLKSRKNMFLTGSAGSGKSYLAARFGETIPFAVMTATTGIAALNIGGETIHRFLGIGISARSEEAGRIISKWERIKASRSPWDVAKWNVMKCLNTIIIDEVSMLRRDQFELIDIVLSYVKDNPLPFGGIKVVLVGDFFQLPPVVTATDLFKFKDLKEPFCFQSKLWQQAALESFNLTSNYRQGEGDFLDALEKIRVGNITKDVEDLLNSRVNAKLNISMEPIKLFSHKIDVAKENIDCLKKLPGEKYVSEAEFDGKEYDVNILKKECPAETNLYFCKGAQIMMLTNDPSKRWVNGTMAIIRNTNPLSIQLSSGLTTTIDLHTWERVVPHVDPKTETITMVKMAIMRQYPFAIAYSSSVHKSQGLTLDYVDVDLTKCFTHGQFYTALSRVKTLSGLTIRGWNKCSSMIDNNVLKFYNDV